MNIVSMTGYGRASVTNDDVSLDIEIKTVNSRYLDFNIKMPREYTQYEIELRKLISETLKRGRVDVFITKQVRSSQACQLEFNRPLFDSLYGLYLSLANELCPEQTAKEAYIRELLSKREIVDFSGSADEVVDEKELLFSGVKNALRDVANMRAKEGGILAKDLLEQVVVLRGLRSEIVEKSKGSTEIYRAKLEERINKLGVEIDPQRLAQEVAIFADKIDITEELVRLNSHLEQFMTVCESTPNGRTLDFLVQECGREFNTIASKVQSAEIQGIAVSGKACLEKIREQVQNIE